MALTSFNFPAPQVVYAPQPLYRPAFPSTSSFPKPDPNTIKKKLAFMNAANAGSTIGIQAMGISLLTTLAGQLIHPSGYQEIKKTLRAPKLPVYLLLGALSTVFMGAGIGALMGGTMAHFAKKKLLAAYPARNNQSQDPLQKPPTILNPQAVLWKVAKWDFAILLSMRLGGMLLTANLTQQPLLKSLKALKNPRIATAVIVPLLGTAATYAWTAKRISSWMCKQVGIEPTD